MSEAFTPGPWVGRDSAGRFLLDQPWSAEHETSDDFMSAPIHANGKVIALLVRDNARSPYVDYSEIDANARLIAAAPDLLEALVLLEKEMVLSGNAESKDYGWKPAIEKTRAAIAKARSQP